MSRGTKSKAVSGEKDSPSQDESGSGDMKIADIFQMMNERFEKWDKNFEAFHEDMKSTNQRLEELQLRVPWSRLANGGTQEGKSVELEGIATETEGIRTIPPELQRQQPLLPQPPMMFQPSMTQLPPPSSQPPPLQHYQSPLHQSRQLLSSPLLAGREQPYFTPSTIGTSNYRSRAGAGGRGAVPAGESLTGILKTPNPPVFSGESVHFRSFEIEAIIFAEYVDFGPALKRHT